MNAEARAACAKKIEQRLLRDLTCRGGLDGAWDDIAPRIQREIRATWREIIEETLAEAHGEGA